MEQGAAVPVAREARVPAFDVLRGTAILGILLMNIVSFGLLSQSYENPRVDGGATGIDLQAFAIASVGFEGTMRGLLSLLFGAGILLLHCRFEAAGQSWQGLRLHVRRMLWLLLLGFVHWSLMLWSGDILFIYAISGLLLLTVVELPTAAQLGLAGLLIAFAVGISIHDDADVIAKHAAYVEARTLAEQGAPLDPLQMQAIPEWQSEAAHTFPTPEMTASMRGWRSGSYWNAVAGQFPSTASFQLGGMLFWLFSDIGPLMLLGMALYRLGILDGRVRPRTYGLMAALGYGIGIPLGQWELDQMLAGDFSRLAISAASRTAPLSRLAMVMGHLALLLLFVRSGALPALQRALAAAGQLALTNYLMQTVICTWLFYNFGPGLGLYSTFQRHELYCVVLAIWAVQLAFSVVWLRYFRFGPVEWLWRSLTYGERQPMRL